MFLLLQLHLYFLFFPNHDQFLDSISKAYPGIVDHLNIASIEKADNSPAEMEIDQSTEEGIVFTETPVVVPLGLVYGNTAKHNCNIQFL